MVGGSSIAAFSTDETWAPSRSATFCAISLWSANTSFKSRSYFSVHTCASVRVSINWAFKMDSARFPAHASLKHVGYIQCAADFRVHLRATIFCYAVVADDLQIGNLRQLGRNTVVNAVGKKCVLFIWKLRLSKGRTAMPPAAVGLAISPFQIITPTTDPSASKSAAIPATIGFRPRPAPQRARRRNRTRDNGTAFKPAFKVFGQSAG